MKKEYSPYFCKLGTPASHFCLVFVLSLLFKLFRTFLATVQTVYEV